MAQSLVAWSHPMLTTEFSFAYLVFRTRQIWWWTWTWNRGWGRVSDVTLFVCVQQEVQGHRHSQAPLQRGALCSVHTIQHWVTLPLWCTKPNQWWAFTPNYWEGIILRAWNTSAYILLKVWLTIHLHYICYVYKHLTWILDNTQGRIQHFIE